MSLNLFIGCQASGKTIENIREATRWLDVLDGPGLFIHHVNDTRDETNLISSNSSSYKGISSKFRIITVTSLTEVKSSVNIDEYDVICVDELQFFPDLESVTTEWLYQGKHMFFSGLISDWRGNDFGNGKDILKLATNVSFLKAKCSWCSKILQKDGIANLFLIPDACRTGKISGNDEQTEVGGSDKYVPLCLKHHVEHLQILHQISL